MSSEDEGRGAMDEPREPLARELADLGPVMLAQERAEAERPDPFFAARLRARLVAGVPAEPDPVFVRDLRTRLTGTRGTSRPRRRSGWAGLLAAALVATLVVALMLRPAPPHHAPMVAWAPPQPGIGDLTRGFPPPCCGGGGGGGIFSPEQSPLDPLPGAPYTGHLRFSAGPLPRGPATLPAYRLRGPAISAARLGTLVRALGIHGPVQRVASGTATWLAAADTGLMRVHSLAVSTLTGEVIYHDTAAQAITATVPPGRGGQAHAVTLARAWLGRLGWPGATMPVLSATDQGTRFTVWTVALGWPGVGAVTTSAVTLWVTSGGAVAEARLWPPIEAAHAVAARGIPAAWAAVRAGAVPIAVQAQQGGPLGDGTAGLERVATVAILTADADGRLYLVPAYRFAGSAQFQVGGPSPGVASSAIPATWYAIAPATAPSPQE